MLDGSSWVWRAAGVVLGLMACSCGGDEPPVPRAAPGAGDWPGFRGVAASGVADGFELPAQWSVPEKVNIKWRVPVAGLGLSCPVVWADRVFITTAVPASGTASLKPGLYGNIESVEGESAHRWVVQCYDKTTGRLLWEQTAHEGVPKIKRHTKSSHANSTPATDGSHVVAFFGAEGIYCYDIDGKPIWQKDLGLLDSGYYQVRSAQWGFGSSPIIHDVMVIVQCDVQEDSFLAALDITDGEQIWRTPRDDVPTWSTPTVYDSPAGPQLVANGYKHIGGYDAATGKPLWRLDGGGDIPVPTPIIAHGLIYITSAHGRPGPIYAVRTSAAGDITPAGDAAGGEHIAWRHGRGGNYMQTPLVYGDLLYMCTDSGVMSCLDAKSGEYRYRERLDVGGGFTASPVAGDGKVYMTGEAGQVVVVKAGPTFEKLAVNELGESCLATPAISEGMLLFRTRHHLIAVGK